MANTQSAYGFAHFGYLPGGAVDYQLTPVSIRAAYSTLIGFGDPVVKENTASAFMALATTANVTVNILQGIFQGCWYTPTGSYPQWSPFWPGASATNGTAYIINAPNALFRVAALLTSCASGQIGGAVNFTGGAPATTGGGFSSATIDMSSIATAGTAVSSLPFKIVSLYPGIGNGSDATTPYGWMIVTFNSQIYKITGGF